MSWCLVWLHHCDDFTGLCDTKTVTRVGLWYVASFTEYVMMTDVSTGLWYLDSVTLFRICIRSLTAMNECIEWVGCIRKYETDPCDPTRNERKDRGQWSVFSVSPRGWETRNHLWYNVRKSYGMCIPGDGLNRDTTCKVVMQRGHMWSSGQLYVWKHVS